MDEPLPESPSDARKAMRLSAITVVWNLIVGGTGDAIAVSTGSLSLIGFGITAVVDSSVSVLLVWRFHAEDRGHAERAERAEARAERLAGVAFVLIAIYLTVQSIRTLATSGSSESTTFCSKISRSYASSDRTSESMLPLRSIDA